MRRDQEEPMDTEPGTPWLTDIQRVFQREHWARRLQAMTKGLAGSTEPGTKHHEPEPVDLTEVQDAVLTDLEAQIEARDATVDTEPLPTVRADRDQLHRVLFNLLSNAIAFVPEDREPRIEVRASRDDGAWCFAVEDNGTGLSPFEREGIFQPPPQRDDADAGESEQRGLAAARRIVEENGGRIWVESGPGPGSTFHFTLPA